MFQAGGSPAGTEFAAMVAEAIFAARVSAWMKRAPIRNAVDRADAEIWSLAQRALKILPGLSPIVGSTEQEAKRKEAELDELILPAVGVWMLSEQMQFRLYDYELDGPLPSDDIRAGAGVHAARGQPMDRADREHLTVRACANLVAKSRSHGTFVGTVEGLVDHMQHWQDKRRLRRLQHHARLVP